MKWTRFRRREAGLSIVEVAVSGLVLSISVAGLVVSVCYARGLERQSAATWRATSAAAAAMEQIRSDSLQNWSTLQTDWNGTTAADANVIDPVGSAMQTSVISDATQLDSSTGMWTTGAIAPNFYLVKIAPATTATDLSRSLVFQSYVANRGALLSTSQAAGTGSENGGATAVDSTFTTAATSAGNISTTPTNVTLSGAVNQTVAFGLSNTSATNKILTAIKVTAPSGVNLTNVSYNTTAIYTNTKGATSVTVGTMATLLPAGIAPGAFSLKVGTALTSLVGKKLTVQLTFKDKSVAAVTVTP
jgi:Tfp pilus assembly protein PilV